MLGENWGGLPTLIGVKVLVCTTRALRKCLKASKLTTFFAVWQQTHCSVSAHAYLLSLSRSMVVLLHININVHVLVSIAATVIGKTLYCVGRCYGLQLLVSCDIG